MTYDEMILRGPDERHEIGTQGGETCGRYPEPDEDAPRGYKPKTCAGKCNTTMAMQRHIATHAGNWHD